MWFVVLCCVLDIGILIHDWNYHKVMHTQFCDINNNQPIISWTVLHWQVPGFKRGPGRPLTKWRSTVNKDLLRMGIIWEETEVAAPNRSEWHRSVAQVESRSRSILKETSAKKSFLFHIFLFFHSQSVSCITGRI